MNYNELIEKKREELGLTNSKMAKLLGMSRTSYYLKCRDNNWSVLEIDRINLILKFSWEKYFDKTLFKD